MEFDDELFLSSYDLIEDEIDWKGISCYHKLSENFIREFKDRVNWNNVLQYQKLSKEFIQDLSIIKLKTTWGIKSDY